MLTKFKEEEGMSLVELIVIISVLGFLMVVGFTKINEIVGGANEVVSEGNRYMESINDLTGDIEDHIAGIESGEGLVEGSTPEGAGTEGDPFKIANYTDLTLIGEGDYTLDKHYELTDNIDASSSRENPAGFIPIGGLGADRIDFSGVFDGNNYYISDLYINRTSYDNQGLFARNVGTIKKTGVVNIDIFALNYVGGLVGFNLSGGTITDSYFTGNINGDDYIGGLAGWNRGVVTNSYAVGNINGNDYIGGLAGHNRYSTARITNSYATVNINGNREVGGLTGRNEDSARVENSYATGDINGNIYVGGLTGRNYRGIITNSYAIGKVIGDSGAGGLIGNSFGGDVNNSYWDITTSGQTSSQGGEGKTTEEMYHIADGTYHTWDFDKIWNIDVGNDYPRLRTQY